MIFLPPSVVPSIFLWTPVLPREQVDQQMVPGGSPESFGAGLCSAFGPSTVSNAFRLITAHMQALRNRSSELAAPSPAPAPAPAETPAPPEGNKRLDDAGEFASLFKLAKLSGRQPKTQAFEAALEALQPVTNKAAYVIELRNAHGAELKLSSVRIALRHPEKFFPSGFVPELLPLPPQDAAAAAAIDWSSATGAAKPSKWPSANVKSALHAANTPADAIAHLERVALVGGFTLSFLELGLNKLSAPHTYPHGLVHVLKCVHKLLSLLIQYYLYYSFGNTFAPPESRCSHRAPN